jgi:hypothetical protein
MEIKVTNPNPVYDVHFTHDEFRLLHILLGATSSIVLQDAYKKMKDNGQTSLTDDCIERIDKEDLMYKMYDKINVVLDKGNK